LKHFWWFIQQDRPTKEKKTAMEIAKEIKNRRAAESGSSEVVRKTIAEKFALKVAPHCY